MKSFRTILFPFTLLAPAKIFACATCYGGSIDSPMADGMNWAILTLGVVVSTVVLSFVAFLIYLIRKSEAVEAARIAATAQTKN